jgi:choline monooxygenase
MMSSVNDPRDSRPASMHRQQLTPLVLPGSAYVGESSHERDQASIHKRSWQFFGLAAEFSESGAYRADVVAGEPVAVVRGNDGKLRAFYNVCQHRGHQILQGFGVTRNLVCPYHAWAYDLSGRLKNVRGAPGVAGETRIELKSVRVDVLAGLVFVNLDANARPLQEEFSGLDQDIRSATSGLHRLRFAGSLSYDLQCDWKAAVENVLECYHCGVAHPAFCDLVDMPNYEISIKQRYSRHVGPGRASSSAPYDFEADRALAVDGIGFRDDYLAWFAWPNAMINRFPGRDNIEVIHMVPVGPERTRQVHYFYFVDGKATDAEASAVKYIDEVLQPEDNRLVESVQAGYRSKGYERGYYVLNASRQDMTEDAVLHFHQMVVDAHAAITARD